MPSTLSGVATKDDNTKLIYGLARHNHWSTFKGPASVYNRYKEYFDKANIPKDKIANGFNKLKAEANKYPVLSTMDLLYDELNRVIECDEEFDKEIRDMMDRLIASDTGKPVQLEPASMGKQLGVAAVATVAPPLPDNVVPPIQQLMIQNNKVATQGHSGGSVVTTSITPRTINKRPGSLKMDEDYEYVIKTPVASVERAEKWSALTPTECEGDFIPGHKFIVQDNDGRQVKISFILRPETGCFPMSQGKVRFEGLGATLDPTGNALTVTYPKHVGVNKPVKLSQNGAKHYFDRNDTPAKARKSIMHLLERQQHLLKVHADEWREYNRTTINLEMTCNPDDVVCFAIVGCDGFINIQIILTVAIVRGKKKQKVLEIEMPDEEMDEYDDDNSDDE